MKLNEIASANVANKRALMSVARISRSESAGWSAPGARSLDFSLSARLELAVGITRIRDFVRFDFVKQKKTRSVGELVRMVNNECKHGEFIHTNLRIL